MSQQQDVNDRRYVHYALTQDAKDIAQRVEDKWTQMMECLEDGISDEDIGTFNRIARLIGVNIEKMLNA